MFIWRRFFLSSSDVSSLLLWHLLVSSLRFATTISFNSPTNLNSFSSFRFPSQYPPFPSLPDTPSSCSLPSIRSGLPAGSSHFPAAASGEDSRTTTSALWEEDRHMAARERRQNHTETGLPTRLQHTQMYDYWSCSHCFQKSWKISLDSSRTAHSPDWRGHTDWLNIVREKLIWSPLLLLPLQTSHTSCKEALSL